MGAGGGFVGAHLFSVILYFPGELRTRPWLLFELWRDISSTGGVIGGLAAVTLFLRRHAPSVDESARRSYVDVAAYVFPVSLMIGRVA